MSNTIAPSVKSVLENLINGNLTDAQEEATFFATITIVQEAMGIGYNYNDALLTASYLKGAIPFQDYCDNLSKE